MQNYRFRHAGLDPVSRGCCVDLGFDAFNENDVGFM